MEIIYQDYLDYSLQKLSENYSDGLILSDLRHRYKEKTGILIESETQQHFEKYYEGKFFERVGNTYKHKILSETQTIILTYGSFSAYLDKLKKKQDEQEKIQQIQNKKLEDDAKLSDLQVKVFPYVFIAGLVGGIYSIVSVLFLLFGESTEEKIQRILESKSKSKPKIENVSTLTNSGKK